MRKFSRLSAIDGMRWPDQVEAVVDVADDARRIVVAAIEDGVRHADQRHEGRAGRLEVAIRLAAEDGGRLAAVHEAAKDAALDVRHPPRRRALVS
jgi:hypothetical protein